MYCWELTLRATVILKNGGDKPSGAPYWGDSQLASRWVGGGRTDGWVGMPLGNQVLHCATFFVFEAFDYNFFGYNISATFI